MATIIKKNFSQPDETKVLDKMKVETAVLGGLKLPRVTVEPGWQWSKNLKPVVGGESCRVHHLIYMISGKLSVRMDDGSEEQFTAGDAGVIPPGHDGWNAGSEPAVWLEIQH